MNYKMIIKTNLMEYDAMRINKQIDDDIDYYIYNRINHKFFSISVLM